MRALVVGAGVGGLTAAVALRRAGIDVEVVERAAGPGRIRVGGGLHLWPNGMRALAQIGLGDAVQAVGETIERLDWHTPEHGLLASADLAATARKVGAPSVGIRRADLLGVLLDAVGEDAIRFGTDVRDEPRNADVVVGADGLHSTLRRELFGDDELRAPGVLVCQGAAGHVSSIPPSVFVEVWAPTLRFGCYPLRDGLNWFAFVRAAEADELALDPHGFLLERTRDWTAPGHEVIAATPAAAVTWGDVVAREPLERWTDGRVALLGDSAHAMTPFTGQGACQAIEDAVVLADCLRAEADVPAALRAYEARRLPRARRDLEPVLGGRGLGRQEEPHGRSRAAAGVRRQVRARRLGPARADDRAGFLSVRIPLRASP